MVLENDGSANFRRVLKSRCLKLGSRNLKLKKIKSGLESPILTFESWSLASQVMFSLNEPS